MAFSLFLNPRPGVPGVVLLPESGFRRASAEIRAWPGHAPPVPEPLALGLAAGHRVASQGPGLAYAVARALVAALARQGVRATPSGLLAGEGRAAAAGMTLVGAGSGAEVLEMAGAIARFGARGVVFAAAAPRRPLPPGVELRLDPAHLSAAAALAEAQGWPLVTAASWPGHAEAPRDVLQGHRLLVEEALAALPAPPTHLIAPPGLAAAASVQLRQRGTPACLVVVEGDAAPLQRRARAGLALPPEATEAAPDLLAWQELERGAFAFLAGPGGPESLLRAVAEQRALPGLDGAARLLLFDMGCGGCQD